MTKNTIKEITNKTHAYILPEYDNIVVRAISDAHVSEYEKEGVQVYSTLATKTVDGTKTDTVLYYVATTDFVKRTSTRASVASKLKDAIAGKDLTSMTAAELVALLQ